MALPRPLPDRQTPHAHSPRTPARIPIYKSIPTLGPPSPHLHPHALPQRPPCPAANGLADTTMPCLHMVSESVRHIDVMAPKH